MFLMAFRIFSCGWRSPLERLRGPVS